MAKLADDIVANRLAANPFLHGPLHTLVGHGAKLQGRRCYLQGHGYTWLAAEGA